MSDHILSDFAIILLRAHVEQIGESYNPAGRELEDLTPPKIDGLYKELLKEQLVVRTDTVVDVDGQSVRAYRATPKGVTRVEETPNR